MKKVDHSPESWRTICWILIAIIIFLIIMWYRSEEYRLELLEELNELKGTRIVYRLPS